MAAKLGRLDAYERVLDELAAERGVIEGRLATSPVEIDLSALREPIAEMVTNLRSLLGATPEEGRMALGALFGQEKLRIRPDPERGFAIQGVATLDLNSLPAPGRDEATGAKRKHCSG